MIQVERSSVPKPSALEEANRAGKKETARALNKANQLLDDQRLAEFKFEFKAYKNKEVKDALECLFHGKCAYCEKRYAGTQPMDVEHWRPKGMALREEREAMKPGYYWLAAEWENLLPSCIDCNRSRKQRIPPDDEEILLGKENQFPLDDEEHRCLNHRMSLEGEVPLLLNPCQDDPERFLEFTLDGFVRPRSRLVPDGAPAGAKPPRDWRRAAASIRVFGLNRGGLIFDRLEVLRFIEQRKRSITILMEILADPLLPAHLVVLVETLLDHEIESLTQFTSPEKPFSQMARQVIDAFFRTVDPANP
jgi:uncharacterized protein (TIGR02646 family)